MELYGAHLNKANNVTRIWVCLVWLSAVNIALMLVMLNIAPAAAQSTVMVSNLGEAEAERHQRTQIGLDIGQAYAQSFTTGSTAVALEKIRLYVRGRFDPNPYLVTRPSVTIRANSPVPGQPGRTLHVLTSPTIDSSIATYDDFTSDGYVLAANTTYWLVVHRPWGTDYFGFSATISENWCRGRGTTYGTYFPPFTVVHGPPEATTPPENAFTGEPGWSLGDYFFYGTGSGWHESNCWSMRVGIYASAQTGQNQAANSPATGGPGITGTVQAGETLTATTDGIEDEDGLPGAVFAYQWVRSGTDIEGAASSTYTMTAADEGKAIQVRVTFTDDAGNAESLTSYAVLSVPPLTIPDEEPPPKSTETREAREAQGAQEAAETPLTAATHDVPTSHNGSDNFKFRIAFSEELETGFSYKTLRDHVFTVEGGTVVGARRLVSGSNIGWEITVDPDSNGDVKITLPVAEDCDAQGAICTEDGTMLSNPLTITIKGPPLTASFESVPMSHNGSDNFKFRIAFSEELETGFSYKTLRDHVFTVEGGTVVGARRLVSGSNIGWEVSVRPDPNGDVTITLPATTDCDAQGAICAGGDKKLSNRLERTVSGPGQ